MGQPATTATQLRDFPGLTDAADALDLRPGASVVQTNLRSDEAGSLRVRPGLREVTFEE